MYETSDFKRGLKIEYNGQPYRIEEFQHVKPGKGNAFTRTKLRNLLTGRVIDPTFKSGDKVGKPNLAEYEMQYLYKEGDEGFVFMDNQSYEQTTLGPDQLGDQAQWLQENLTVAVLFYNDRPISVEMPNHVFLKVTSTEPGVKGDTATGAMKVAIVETGASVMVPLFINEGDRLKIDTRTGDYVERA